MDIHVCKQCGSRFVYCRKCVFRPVRYKDAGFCSKECYEASKNKVEFVVEEIPAVEVVVDIPTVEDVVLMDEEISVTTEISASIEDTIEATIEAKPIIKNETDTYKKKKNKYKVHE